MSLPPCTCLLENAWIPLTILPRGRSPIMPVRPLTPPREPRRIFFLFVSLSSFPSPFLWSHGLYLSSIVSASQICRPLVRNKTAIGILIESCDLLRLLWGKGLKNMRRETDLAFGDLIEILGVAIILAQVLWIFIRMLFGITLFSLHESLLILMKIYVISIEKKHRARNLHRIRCSVYEINFLKTFNA